VSFQSSMVSNLNRGGKLTGLRFNGENEGGQVPARFNYAHVREGGTRRGGTERGGGGSRRTKEGDDPSGGLLLGQKAWDLG
jgi:hypothetical protein